ncbi:nucleotidyl transferase AbiEii/AbiGii toxin family protein [Candidatus Micrarchaeota archaeon]|nr:nucleotidyl transferase AbiEii/AbiGii toxin family protein [Candidatus Micrarchaeota archaeon]
MIDKETLLKIAKLNNMKPWQQEKHYIQSVILTCLAEKPLVFKGGTYLWFFHNLPRFSEDLDFTLIGDLKENLAEKVSESLILFGIENEFKLIKNDEITLSFRIAAKGPLHTSEKDLCFVYVEISKREEIIEKTKVEKLDFPAYKLPIKIMQGMALDEICAEKIRAIVTREKARDLYDLWFLIENKNVSFKKELVNNKLGFYSKKFNKKEFIEALQQKKKYFSKELDALVFGEVPKTETCVKKVLNWLD